MNLKAFKKVLLFKVDKHCGGKWFWIKTTICSISSALLLSTGPKYVKSSNTAILAFILLLSYHVALKTAKYSCHAF